MGSIAVQSAVGSMGNKAVTELSYSFSSLINQGKFQFGANKDGLFLLNTSDQDDGVPFERSITFATTDIGVHHPKKGRSFYIGIDTDSPFEVHIKFSGQLWVVYDVIPPGTGLQRIKVPIGSREYGRYFTLKITSDNWFRLDSVDGLFIIRSSGLNGGS